MARAGELAPDAAERQLNSHLLAASARGHVATALILPVTDAPHHTLLPDLGNALHRILCRQPFPCSLSSVLEQSIPSVRLPPRPATYQDSQDVLLNLVLALLLGTYAGGAVKRPMFDTRVRVFARIRGLLTSSPEEQTGFCRKHPAVILLAAMEYVARIVPALMPAQAAFLHERDPSTAASFRRIPPICDELRQTLDEAGGTDWAQIQSWCAAAVERISRLKKSVGLAAPREAGADLSALQRSPGDLPAYWTVPLLRGSAHEYHLLGQGLGLNGQLLHHIQQRDVQVRALPPNLHRQQLAAVGEVQAKSTTTAFLKTRHFICSHCILHTKPSHAQHLRLDTIRQSLVCSTCAKPDLLSIDMMGRVLRHRGQSYFLCPGCVSIQAYTSEEDAQVWFGSGCRHKQRPPAPKTRPPCDFCMAPSGACQVTRVDHLTGQMVAFAFCQRHAPSPADLQLCVNARQLSKYRSKGI